MSKITSVTSQRSLHRFNIFIDNKFAFGADEDLIVNHRLITGKEISSSDLEQLIFEAEVGKLMERMYRLFSVRARSEKEVRDYLRNLSYKRKIKDQGEISGQAIELLIDKLNQKELLNDEQFAKAWVESRRKKKGPRVLKQELFQKGISKEVVSNVMDQVLSEEEQKTAESLLDRKIRHWKNLSSLEFRKKASDFLMRRGFEYETVKSVVEKYLRKV